MKSQKERDAPDDMGRQVDGQNNVEDELASNAHSRASSVRGRWTSEEEEELEKSARKQASTLEGTMQSKWSYQHGVGSLKSRDPLIRAEVQNRQTVSKSIVVSPSDDHAAIDSNEKIEQPRRGSEPSAKISLVSNDTDHLVIDHTARGHFTPHSKSSEPSGRQTKLASQPLKKKKLVRRVKKRGIDVVEAEENDGVVVQDDSAEERDSAPQFPTSREAPKNLMRRQKPLSTRSKTPSGQHARSIKRTDAVTLADPITADDLEEDRVPDPWVMLHPKKSAQNDCKDCSFANASASVFSEEPRTSIMEQQDATASEKVPVPDATSEWPPVREDWPPLRETGSCCAHRRRRTVRENSCSTSKAPENWWCQHDFSNAGVCGCFGGFGTDGHAECAWCGKNVLHGDLPDGECDFVGELMHMTSCRKNATRIPAIAQWYSGWEHFILCEHGHIATGSNATCGHSGSGRFTGFHQRWFTNDCNTIFIFFYDSDAQKTHAFSILTFLGGEFQFKHEHWLYDTYFDCDVSSAR